MSARRALKGTVLKRDPYADLTAVLNSQVTHFPLRMRDETQIKVLADATGIVTRDVPDGTPAWWDVERDTIYLLADAIFGVTADSDCSAVANMYRTGDYKAEPMIPSGRSPLSPAAAARNKLFGFINHEISHSYNSRWLDGKPIEGRLMDPCMTMEEIRVESIAVAEAPMEGIASLRLSFAWLLDKLAESKDLPASPNAIAKMWALTVGRHKSGIALWDEVGAVDIIARASLGDSVVDLMGDILDDAVESGDFDYRMKLAQEWVDLFPPEDGEGEGEGGEGSGEGVPSGCSSSHKHKSDKKDADAKAKGEGEGEGEGEGDPDGPPSTDESKYGKGTGEDPDAVEGSGAAGGIGGYDKDAVTLIQGAIRKTKDQMLDKPYVDMEGLKLADPRVEAPAAIKRKRTGSYWTTENPTSADRNNAQMLARHLENLALPTITKVKRPSMLPPGRLRSREGVRLSAEHHLGQLPTATPWEMTKRTRTRIKPVIVGCMTDTSGSMSWATKFVGQFAWTVSHAGKSIGARTASITFGNSVHIVTAPGDTPRQITIRGAHDGSEAFDQGAAVMDGLLHYTTFVNAAKVLFVVSDGHFVGPQEREKCCLWTEKLTQAGTAIIWVANEGEYDNYQKHVRKPGAMRSISVDYYNPDTTKLFRDMQAVILEIARATGME